jgi:hypothetical protein
MYVWWVFKLFWQAEKGDGFEATVFGVEGELGVFFGFAKHLDFFRRHVTERE